MPNLRIEECLDCGACVCVCPKQAISMKADEKGFRFPIINENKCIECKLCEKVCKKEYGNVQKPKAIFAYKNTDEIREKSSSGGAYSLFMDFVLEKKGAVYGAELINNKCTISRADNRDEAQKYCKSKYVQSDINTQAVSIGEDLKKGLWVLFCGLGCQVYGVRQYLSAKKIDMSRLILVDLICHGAPSPKIFQDYVAFCEHKYRKNISFFDTRVNTGKHGEKDWLKAPHTTRPYFADGKVAKDNYYLSNGYVELFYSNLALKYSCYECPIASKGYRSSDFTIGDFWLLSKTENDFSDRLGVSIIVANNDYSEHLLRDMITDHRGIFKEVDYETLLASNLTYIQPTKKPSNRDDFWGDYFKKGITYVLKKYCGYTLDRRIKRFIKLRILRRPAEY